MCTSFSVSVPTEVHRLNLVLHCSFGASYFCLDIQFLEMQLYMSLPIDCNGEVRKVEVNAFVSVFLLRRFAAH